MDRDFKLKLFIENKIQKVLFAEVSNDVVDFLLSLLSLPIGTVTKLLTKESMVGCLGATYGSLEKLDDDYFRSSKTKSRLLNPTSSKAASIESLWFSFLFDHVTHPKYYQCSGPGGLDCKPCYQRSSNYVTDVYESPCPVCKRQMTMKVEYTGEEKGFVKDAMPYIIMDG
ncbi:hypothetical protein LUZ62_018119 [Rhynchospora pubera]|uniref:Uncharacterized protein n=1 Tax=Rhynchospora pubera TaxID=906938 RepID=A0AAV8GRA0_9POAL|nr:hypothetical protein LUZ62_018119 [Rhynchospora pubera]